MSNPTTTTMRRPTSKSPDRTTRPLKAKCGNPLAHMRSNTELPGPRRHRIMFGLSGRRMVSLSLSSTRVLRRRNMTKLLALTSSRPERPLAPTTTLLAPTAYKSTTNICDRVTSLCSHMQFRVMTQPLNSPSEPPFPRPTGLGTRPMPSLTEASGLTFVSSTFRMSNLSSSVSVNAWVATRPRSSLSTITTRPGEMLGVPCESTILTSLSYVTDTTTSSFQRPSPQSTTSVETSSEVPVATESPEPVTESVTQGYINPVQAPPPTENESEKRRKAREMVAHDLETWQTKFASQADEGANDLEERVDEIAKRMIEENVQITGRQLFDDLESTIASELEALRIKISALAGSVDENTDNVDEKIVAAVRSAGMAIKKKAQAIRQWREGYEKELQETVITVADVHFQLLDETRNLALQQIGMRWAWTDGVTYKDWAKYHELKSTLNEWTEQLKQLIVTHPSLLQAQDASAQVEDEGMEIASVAAKELARLKEVARWKVVARDSSDDFDSDAMKLAAEEAIAAKKAEESKDADEQTPAEDDVVSSLSASAEEATSQAEDAEQDLEDFVSSVAEPIKEEVSSVVDDEPNVIEKATSVISESIESVVSDASSLAFDGQESVSSIADEASETEEALASPASESASSVIEEVSSQLSETFESATKDAEPEDSISNGSEDPLPADDEPLVEIEEDPLTHRDETPLSNEQHVKPAFLGAAAQEVPNRQVVLEDYVDTDYIASATDAAQAAYSTAVSRASEQYSSALSVVSAQIYGTPKPVHEQLFASVSSAYDKAVSAAGDKLNHAVEAATTATQLPATTTIPNWVDWERIESIATQRLNEGRLWAEIQYQSALIAMGLATPTPSSSMEKYYEQAKLNYFAGLGIAQDRYASFIAGASSALSSLTATPTPTDLAGSASSVASVARESAASAAQAAGDAAGSAYSAAGDTIKSATQAVEDSVSSVVDAASEQISSAGLAIAESWNTIVEQISGQVYGEPTQIAWHEHIWSDASSYAAAATDAVADKASIASDAAAASAVTASAEAAKQYESVSELVSELISGKEPSFTESVLSRLQAAYATAAASVESLASEANEAASSVGEKVGSAASQATEAVKESFQHAKDEL
ncbi:hypothetical protein FALCPG4_001956 [Fusarium falciforme]